MIKIPTANEAKKRTDSYDVAKKFEVRYLLNELSELIELAINIGQYSICNTLSNDEKINNYIKEYFMNLGYIVSFKKEKFTHANEITISWSVPKEADKKT